MLPRLPQTTVVCLMITIQCLLYFSNSDWKPVILQNGGLAGRQAVVHCAIYLCFSLLLDCFYSLCLSAAASLLEAELASLSWGYTSASLRLLQTRVLLLLLFKILLVSPRDVGWTHMSSDNFASASSAEAYLGFVNISFWVEYFRIFHKAEQHQGEGLQHHQGTAHGLVVMKHSWSRDIP